MIEAITGHQGHCRRCSVRIKRCVPSGHVLCPWVVEEDGVSRGLVRYTSFSILRCRCCLGLQPVDSVIDGSILSRRLVISERLVHPRYSHLGLRPSYPEPEAQLHQCNSTSASGGCSTGACRTDGASQGCGVGLHPQLVEGYSCSSAWWVYRTAGTRNWCRGERRLIQGRTGKHRNGLAATRPEVSPTTARFADGGDAG